MMSPNSIVALDPTDERNQASAILVPRPATLDGKVIGLLSNNKPHSEELLLMIAKIIGERYRIKGIVAHNKGGHQWPARREDLEELAKKCDVAVHATAEWGSCTACSVHDAMEMELLGVPSTVVTTSPFVNQARAMSRMRGDPGYCLAVIDHPIVTLTHDELLERARIAVPQVIKHLTDRW